MHKVEEKKELFITSTIIGVNYYNNDRRLCDQLLMACLNRGNFHSGGNKNILEGAGELNYSL